MAVIGTGEHPDLVEPDGLFSPVPAHPGLGTLSGPAGVGGQQHFHEQHSSTAWVLLSTEISDK